jgi:hypothetical protein
MQKRNPVFGVPVVSAMPLKVSIASSISGKRKEKRRLIQPMPLAKLRKLFGCSLLTED